MEIDPKYAMAIAQNTALIVSSIIVYFITKQPLKAYKEYRTKKSAVNLWERGIEDMRLIRNAHTKLHLEDGIPRNAFFVAHNGGDAPSKCTDFFTSVKDETGVDFEGKPLGYKMELDYGTPIKVDFSYAEMIEQAYTHGQVHYRNVDDMNDCLLKRIYLSEGVAESIIVFYSLDTVGFRFGYASHARYRDMPKFTASQINSILMSGNRLRTQFKTKLRA